MKQVDTEWIVLPLFEIPFDMLNLLFVNPREEGLPTGLAFPNRILVTEAKGQHSEGALYSLVHGVFSPAGFVDEVQSVLFRQPTHACML